MKVSELTAKKLNKISTTILKYPNHFEMDSFFNDKKSASNPIAEELVKLNGGTCEKMIVPGSKSCGTTACIAGWALHFDKTPLKDFVYQDFEKTGMKVLGITSEQADLLFYEWSWPQRFRFDDEDSAEDKSVKASARIDYFIQTGK